MHKIISATAFGLVLCACASQEEKQNTTAQPMPEIITIKDPAAPSVPGLPTRSVKKNLFNVVVNPNNLITVNGVDVKDTEALKQLMLKSNKPVITIAVHRCVATDYAKNLMNIIQPLTDVPVAYSAFGKYSDKECE